MQGDGGNGVSMVGMCGWPFRNLAACFIDSKSAALSMWVAVM